MRIVRTTSGLQTWRRQHDAGRTAIGFVPTMGALHDGHRSLMRRARRLCRTVVVSIFVNPLQFGPAEDYLRYPRDTDGDLAICREEQVDILFLPTPDTFYPQTFRTTVAVETLTRRWEGEQRPAHFQGVATVMARLLNLVRPTQTFLGQKDYQQCLVIRQLVQDMGWDTRVRFCPTIRDADGLALSSRNQYLTGSQRQRAPVLYRALLGGKAAIARGIRRARQVEKTMAGLVQTGHPDGVDYLACCDARTLEPLVRIQGDVVLLGAIRIGGVRFIDNLMVRVGDSRG
ncbi:MAG: pantoate--beta-alanine ligase [Nitrospira sp.]|nr:pantoate--beta-alanine ligase [Nitrospira sp.]